MAGITEKSRLVLPVGAVCAALIVYFVWSHRRVDAIETHDAVKDVEIRVSQDALAGIQSKLETISRDTTDLRGDMREVRAILENRLSRAAHHDESMP